ncbi:MAG: hypothetical protein U1E60_23910 [Reyranellaceae bacterium]
MVTIAGAPPAYVVLLNQSGGQVVGIRDFALARHAMDGAESDA